MPPSGTPGVGSSSGIRKQRLNTTSPTVPVTHRAAESTHHTGDESYLFSQWPILA